MVQNFKFSLASKARKLSPLHIVFKIKSNQLIVLIYNQVEFSLAADDPVTCAAYAKQNGLLALEGW